MKILLKRATYYFNDGIVLGPLSREADVDLNEMSDSSIRKLNAGVRTGVIEITEGFEEFEAKVVSLSAKKEDAPVVEAKEDKKEVVEQIKEEVKVVEDTDTVKVEEVKEETTKKPAPRRKTTAK